MDPQIARLTQRVYQLEQELMAMRAQLGMPDPTIEPQPTTNHEPQMQSFSDPPSSQRVPSPHTPSVAAVDSSRGLEEALVGTWFPRVGAVAILIGAGFAFRYAVEHGLIGPVMRVAIGLLVGVFFLGWGRWARGRGYSRLAEAVTGGGSGLLYLSILAGARLYHLFPGSLALVLFVAIAALTAGLAISYNSLALAVLATGLAFLNPFLLNLHHPALAVLGYVLIIDVAVFTLATMKRWPSLDWVAFAGSWLVIWYIVDIGDGDLRFATALAVVISAVPLVRRLMTIGNSANEVWLLAVNAVAYIATGLAILRKQDVDWQALFLALVGAIHLAGALGAKKFGREVTQALLGTAIACFILAVPYQWTGLALPTAWIIEGTALAALAWKFESGQIRSVATGVLGLGLLATLVMLTSRFEPTQLIFSTDSIHVFSQILLLYLAGYFLRRLNDHVSDQAAIGAAIGANVLTLFWLSSEANQFFDRFPSNSVGAAEFTVTAIWGLYAAVLMEAGFLMRRRWIRLMAVALFTLVIAKVVLADVWLLDIGFRILVFIGLGIFLLLSSARFHRFRELILVGRGIEEGARPDDESAPEIT